MVVWRVLGVIAAVACTSALSGCGVGVGIGIPIFPGVSLGVGAGSGGLHAGIGVGAGPIGAGVGMGSGGVVTGGVGVGVGGRAGNVGIGVGTGVGTVLYDPARDGAQAPQAAAQGLPPHPDMQNNPPASQSGGVNQAPPGSAFRDWPWGVQQVGPAPAP